jgi:hypothetical protein
VAGICLTIIPPLLLKQAMAVYRSCSKTIFYRHTRVDSYTGSTFFISQIPAVHSTDFFSVDWKKRQVFCQNFKAMGNGKRFEWAILYVIPGCPVFSVCFIEKYFHMIVNVFKYFKYEKGFPVC